MSALYGTALVVLGVAVFLVIRRIGIGPTDLDRTLALDVLVVLMVSAIAVAIMLARLPSALPIMVVVSMAGFVGTVSVARFIARPSDEDADS